MFLSRVNVSLLLFLPHFLSLKINKIFLSNPKGEKKSRCSHHPVWPGFIPEFQYSVSSESLGNLMSHVKSCS